MSVRNVYGNAGDYNTALARGGVTTTGKTINAFLAAPDREFDVVVLPSGSLYGQMMVENDPVSPETEQARSEYQKHARSRVLARPTVFWCPDYDFTYCGDVSGVSMQGDGTVTTKTMPQLVHGDYYYKYPNGQFGSVSVPVVRYTRSEMPPWVVLYHEIGHVKQYYSGTPQRWNQRLQDTDEIEADNLRLHENPLCLNANIAIRAHYKHMVNGFGIVASAYAVPNKRPALRISPDSRRRIQDDQELARAINHQSSTGFFRK